MSTVGPLCPVLLTASWHSILTRVVVFELMCVDSVAVQGKNLKLHVRTWQFVHCKALLWKCEWNHNDVISVVQFKSWNTRILNTATTEQTNRRASDRADRLASNKKKNVQRRADKQTNKWPGRQTGKHKKKNVHQKWLASRKIWSVEETETLSAGTKPRTLHRRWFGRERVERGNARRFSLKGRERDIVNQDSIGTVSKVLKIRNTVAFPSVYMPS